MANPKGNPQNLIQNQPKEKQPTPKERRKNASKAGKASAKATAERKKIREELLLLLSEGDTQKRACLAIINKVLEGDVPAFKAMLEALGEKPSEKIEIGNLDDKPFEYMDLSKLSNDELKAILMKSEKNDG